MVVSESPDASHAGADMLLGGGNAVDAAVAAAFTLAVTSPWGGNLAGGTLAVLHRAHGAPVFLDARERAPAGAHRALFQDGRGGVVPGRSTASPLAVAVPGTVDGLLRLWEDHGSGRVSREALLAPAAERARRGFAPGKDLIRRLNEHGARLVADTAAARLFCRRDRPWRVGDPLVQEDLARVLEEIARRGRDGFYEGWVAERIVKGVGEGGLLTREDLSGYRSVYREPVVGGFRGHRVLSAGLPSAGGPLLVQILHMLATFPEADLRDPAGRVHLLAECLHLAHADRAALFGDPDHVRVPLAALLSPDYARRRAASVSRDRAAPASRFAPGLSLPATGAETTHLSVVDGAGNAVALTTTLNDGFGCARVAAGTGVLLNNGMDDFTARPGAPNLFGLVDEGAANAIAPGKRPISLMTPTIVTGQEGVRLVLGSPGGPRILSAVLQVMLRTLVDGLPVDRAVAAPRIHAQNVPHIVHVERDAVPAAVQADLEARGHRLEVFPGGWIGRVNAIAVSGGHLAPGPDVRRGDNAAAWARHSSIQFHPTDVSRADPA
jgi:gamma-glutamyltranspeptidase/glutathione hydrolase